MAFKTTRECWCLTILTNLLLVNAFIDIEELQTINYGINIVKEPVAIPEHYPESAILVTSKHGQQYQCVYPTHHQQRQQKEEEEKIALEKGVVELLRPLNLKPCMIKTKDWWTYEVCFGQHVRQYHIEDGSIKGNIMYLGHYQSDFDWNNETVREARVRSKISSGRYHSQYYSNGSKCDLTGSGRQTEVRFVCEEGEDDFIARVDEPETCVYVITVHTSRICRHPHLKSPTQSQPIPIICNPLLTEHQFLQYQTHTEALRLREEEAKARARAEQEQKEKEKAEAAAKKEDNDMEEELTDSLNTILKKTVSKDLQDKTDSSSNEADLQKELQGGWKLVKELDDLEKLLDPQGILSNMAMSSVKEQLSATKQKSQEYDKNQATGDKNQATGDKNQASRDKNQASGDKNQASGDKNQASGDKNQASSDNQIPKTAPPGPSHETQADKQEATGPQEETNDIDPLTFDSELEEFEQEVKTLRERQTMSQQRLQQIKTKVKRAVTSQFKEIIEEAEAELGGEVDETLALTQLSSSLNLLMDKLRDSDTDKEKLQDSDTAEQKHEDKKEGDEKPETTSISPTKDKPQLQNEDSPAGEVTQKGESSNGVQAPPNTLRSEEDDESLIKMATEMATNQQKVLEGHFKEQLEKAGIDPSSVKVHVKIIGGHVRSGGDDEDDSLHVISDDGSHQFQSMLVAILGGGNGEAMKEENRQTSLEEGYNFVLDNVVAEKSSDDGSITADSKDSSDKDISKSVENSL